MSVKIEILDYQYGTGENLVNMADGTPQTGWSFASSTTADWDGDGTNNYLYYNGISAPVIEGHEYTVTLKITNYTTSVVGSDMGVGSLHGVGTSVRLASNGSVTHTFTATSSGSIHIYGRGYNNGTQKITLIDNDSIDWNKSILGELDVTDHSDFPLALTFQISEIKDLTSTSGDYSKTFKIPATKNNNKIFKNLFIPNIESPNNITESKPCRILINNLYSLVGVIRVSGIGGYGENPSYYNCIFFGNNLGWASGLEGQYMDTIWGTEGDALTYNKNSIVATWQHEDCANVANSPIVYPITSYGDYNDNGGIDRTIQLLDTATDANGWGPTKVGYWGWTSPPNPTTSTGGNSYGTPVPTPDWRPAVFVKTTLEKIFKKVGYVINSEFMNTDMFKKLVWLLPNFTYTNTDERSADYNVRSNFYNGVSMSATVYSSGGSAVITEDGIMGVNWGGYMQQNYGQWTYSELGRGAAQATGTPVYPNGTPSPFPLDAARFNVTLDNGNYVDTVNDEITIGEYGFYTISLSGIQGRLANGWKGGVVEKAFSKIHICVNLEIQTVGETSWNIVNRSEGSMNTHQVSNTAAQWTDGNESVISEWGTLSSVSEIRYLNKGDKIRLTTGTRLEGASGQNFVVQTFYRAAGSSADFDISIDPDFVEYGQTYNLKDVIDPEYKQLDFIKGVVHAFNLNMTTDESTRTINIEPFNSFYKPYGSAIDWTFKLGRDKEIQDKWLKTDLKRDIVFKYKTDDKDKKVEWRGTTYFHDILDEYPYMETLPPTFEKGQTTYENPFFAGTWQSKDQDGVGGFFGDIIDTAYSACLWTDRPSPNDAYRPDKGYEFLPRLLYWNKYSPVGNAGQGGWGIPKRAEVQTWIYTKVIVADSTVSLSGTYLSNIYPQATMINRDSTTSPNLAYGNVWVKDYDDATNTYSSTQTGEGLYDTYYKNMIEMLKANPRVRTLYVDLKTTDIINLDFTKLIYIDGAYWRLSKVIDFRPNKNEPTKVELIEWFQLGQFAAAAPTVGNTGGYGGGGSGDPLPPILQPSF